MFSSPVGHGRVAGEHVDGDAAAGLGVAGAADGVEALQQDTASAKNPVLKEKCT